MLLQNDGFHDDDALLNAPLVTVDEAPKRHKGRSERREETAEVLKKLGEDGALATLDAVLAVRSQAIDNKTFGFDTSFRQFVTLMALLTPQSYGARMQRYISLVLKYFPVSAHDNRGDFRDGNNVHLECKASLIGEPGELNVVQIRPWQTDVGYVIVGVDIRPQTRFETYMFMLTKEEVLEEWRVCGGSHAHGTKKSNKKNKNVELRLTLNADPADKDFARWCRKYRCRYDLEYRANLYFQRGELRA